ncbi:histidine phosphatase family protein [Pseudooceanicola sp. C21-150M6]|uniref:histidine phosphatase family protein n=1 Tax=Pseudooceanicola sp. C21-150M6 TaxID=3434355 RepID=UPI003D7F3373
MPLIRYLTHPQIVVDAAVPVPDWSLSPVGAARVAAIADAPIWQGTRQVISSGERKALETAGPIATCLGLPVTVRERMGENDRSSTGFLPPDEFELMANRFFGDPDISAEGWETARDAQSRILAEVLEVIEGPLSGDVLIVGHGGVGTLLWCALSGVPIDRAHDQGPGGGGNWFAFDAVERRPFTGWLPMEQLIQG